MHPLCASLVPARGKTRGRGAGHPQNGPALVRRRNTRPAHGLGGQSRAMDHTFVSALVLLLLVLDPFGSLPIFISVLKSVPPERRRIVACREVGIAFGVLALFMVGGQAFLQLMRLSERSLEVAGGVILLIIAVRMVFAGGGEVYAKGGTGREPFIFPLAVPLLAGPSAMATVLLLASRQPESLWLWMGALTVAMLVSGVVLLAAERLRQLLGDSVVAATEKLMGLVLTAIAIEMILAGLKRYFFE
jgi:MarC family membrane protein